MNIWPVGIALCVVLFLLGLIALIRNLRHQPQYHDLGNTEPTPPPKRPEIGYRWPTNTGHKALDQLFREMNEDADRREGIQ